MNNLKNVTVNPFALGESEKNRDFYLYKGKGQDSFLATHLGYTTTGERILAKVKPLDAFDLHPDRIKIDTEGYELQVLKGAMRTIRDNHPMLLIETHDENDVARIETSLFNYEWKHIHREQPGNIRQTILIGTC